MDTAEKIRRAKRRAGYKVPSVMSDEKKARLCAIVHCPKCDQKIGAMSAAGQKEHWTFYCSPCGQVFRVHRKTNELELWINGAFIPEPYVESKFWLWVDGEFQSIGYAYAAAQPEGVGG